MQEDERGFFHESVWKSQEVPAVQLTMEDVCALARQREKWGVRAYWMLLGFSALFAAAFVRNLTQFRNPWLITGAAWTLALLCSLAWRLARSGPSRMRPAEPCAQFLRRELESKRQGLLWLRWFPILLIPAILSSWWGGGPLLRAQALGIHAGWFFEFSKGPAILIVMAVPLAFVFFAFSRQAQKAGDEIEKLRGMLERTDKGNENN